MQIKYYSGFQVISILHEIGGDKMLETIERFAKEPSADVVEVVRCRDCTWWKSIFSWNGKEHKVCVSDAYEPSREADDYCSYGERKEDEIHKSK